MRALAILFGGAVVGLVAVAVTRAHEHPELPAGPIRDRHELMEQVGKNAKIIGEALKAGNVDKVSGPASEIAVAAKKAPALFPAGSEHPKSRAKPEVWTKPDVFAAEAKKLEDAANALAKAANEGGDAGEAAKQMFAVCKSCHTEFRVPED